MKPTKLYSGANIEFEKFENGDYRVTFFKDCHWHGDITFNESGIIYNDLGDNNF